MVRTRAGRKERKERYMHPKLQVVFGNRYSFSDTLARDEEDRTLFPSSEAPLVGCKHKVIRGDGDTKTLQVK